MNLPKRFSETISIYVAAAHRLVATPDSLLSLTEFDLAERDAKAAIKMAYGEGRADLLNQIVREAYRDVDCKAPAKCMKARRILKAARDDRKT